MDFADSPEHAAFRAEFRHWLEEHLPPEICVDDATDQRVAPDRETLEKRIAWQKRCMPPAGSAFPGQGNIAVAAPALCSRSFSTRNIFVPAPRPADDKRAEPAGPDLETLGDRRAGAVARHFLESECNTQFVRQRMAEPAPVTDAFWQKLAEQGWLGIVYPEKEGGSGLGLVDLIVLMEEAGSAVMPAHSSRPS